MMVNKGIRAIVRRSGAVVVVAAALTAAGCGTSVDGTATAASTSAAATSSSSSTTSTAPREADLGGRVDIDVEIGDCVRLGGTADAATIDEAVCGSDKSNYKVVGKAAKNAQCASDVDQVYYETRWGNERGALCLDIDWVMGGCMSLPDGDDDEPQRVECDDPYAPGIERAIEVIEGVVDVEQCSEGGYVHDEREFTVCTETVRPL
ncbi:putative lipoprotein [Prescottella equi 103S]|nr:putative lipoprotein [Prescottella equi 103S]